MTVNAQILNNRPLPGAQINFNHPLAKGLLCYFLCNDIGQRLIDSSVYRRHGLAVGGKGLWVGRVLNGTTDYATFPYPGVVVYLAVWVKVRVWTASSRIVVVPFNFAVWGAPFIEFALGLGAAANTFAMECNVNGVYKTVASTTTFMTERDYFVEASYDNATLRLYVNSNERASLASAGTITRYTQTSIIGSRAPTPNSLFPAIVKAVIAYNRIPTQIERQKLYEHPYDMFLKGN